LAGDKVVEIALRGFHKGKSSSRLDVRTARVDRSRYAGGSTTARSGLESFPATCEGQTEPVRVTTGGGASFRLDGQHYLLTSIDATFVPDQGEPRTFTKTYGQRTRLGGSEITCTAVIEDPEGTVTFIVTAVAVP
jgi:hypothetical protein